MQRLMIHVTETRNRLKAMLVVNVFNSVEFRVERAIRGNSTRVIARDVRNSVVDDLRSRKWSRSND